MTPYLAERERSRRLTTLSDGATHDGEHVLLEASALANAARELLRFGFAEDARALIVQLCHVLDMATGPRAEVVDLATERAKKR